MTVPTATEPNDALSDLMGRMRWDIANIESRGYAPRELRRLAGSAYSFHYVASGELELRTDGLTATVATGDVVLLPHHTDHTLVSMGPAALLSGSMTLAAPEWAPLGRRLPEVLVACRLAVREPLTAELLAGISRENEAARLGAVSMMNGLANVVAAAAIRAWIEGVCDTSSESWLVSLQDPLVSLALDAIHANPGAAWTVADLARVAISSRSTFAARFKGTVGETPARYLARFRMTRAMEQLRDGVGIGSVAESLGYGSDVAFSRAFRRHTGTSPGAWRQRA